MKKSNLVYLFHKVGKLKELKRAGWERVGIPNPESVAEHSFRCAFMAMILCDIFEVDCEKIIKLALLHDIAEIETGDITPHDDVSFEDRRGKENIAIMDIFKSFHHSHYYNELLTEYFEGKTYEAKLVRNLDKFEMALTAMEYKEIHPEIDLEEFIDEAQKQIHIPEIAELLKELKMQEKAT